MTGSDLPTTPADREARVGAVWAASSDLADDEPVRRQAVIQLASTLRNVGRPDETVVRHDSPEVSGVIHPTNLRRPRHSG